MKSPQETNPTISYGGSGELRLKGIMPNLRGELHSIEQLKLSQEQLR